MTNFKHFLIFFILFLGINFSYSQAKLGVNIQLAKDTFKMYEPVLAKLNVINRDVKQFSFYYFFDNTVGQINFKITDNLGNIWDSNKCPVYVDLIEIGPRQIINPGDTFLISVPINNWGERTGLMFLQFGYFPSGRKFRAFFYYGDNHSSEVEFNVIEPNEEDNNIIQHADSIAVSNYPYNVFTERFRAETIWWYFDKIKKDELDFEFLVKDYKDFFKKFPNSFYMYDDDFMTPLYFALSEENYDVHDLILDMKKRFNNKNLNYLLNQHSTFNRIKTLLKRMSIKISN